MTDTQVHADSSKNDAMIVFYKYYKCFSLKNSHDILYDKDDQLYLRFGRKDKLLLAVSSLY